MKVIFSHGKESGPWGSKIKKLADIAQQHGHAVDSIDYTHTLDPDERIGYLLNILRSEQESPILVGSSMGGYVSLVASQSIAVKALFLLAPAMSMPSYKWQEYNSLCPHIEIVHGWSDEVIPVEHSIRYAREADCELHLVSGDHRLMNSLDVVVSLFERFLGKL